ncbi:MAG: type II toxin-antitoxin system RelE/ParE family toxin [Myxococcales bacterium]|nr:type II toxin-antitoxin system RelE/ParE family toxin [Myxococcales bacterium]
MTRTLRVDPAVVLEIREAVRWYEGREAGLGARFVTQLDEAMGRAAALGPDCRPAVGVDPALGVRRVLVRQFPYVVFVVVVEPHVRVIAVAHGRRRPGYSRPRLR